MGRQHDPNTYETVQGRIFEPKSLMSKESIDIIYFWKRFDLRQLQYAKVYFMLKAGLRQLHLRMFAMNDMG